MNINDKVKVADEIIHNNGTSIEDNLGEFYIPSTRYGFRFGSLTNKKAEDTTILRKRRFR